ncbi:MAG TPA: DUF397 domain-containing protein [Pseudonocardiaceae bacterium]|nr:DUF397 domain-containing protein [Pseudonocardiaceae bacterium]
MVEVPPPPTAAAWRKSSFSADGVEWDCVQAAGSRGRVWVRDSKNPLGSVLGFTREGWAAFLVGVQCDEFEHSRALA